MDVISSKIHTFGIMLAAARDTPSAVRRLGEHFHFLFQGEPLVAAISASMTDDVVAVETPQTLPELSRVFVATSKCLRDAVDECDARLASEARGRDARAGPRPGGPALQAFNLVTNAGRFAAGSREEQAAIEQRASDRVAAAAAVEASSGVAILRDGADVMAALKHVSVVQGVATAAWAGDRQVQWAMTALDVWSVAAERFLADAQAARALAAAHQCLQFSVVQVGTVQED
jgi:hypothetical protein